MLAQHKSHFTAEKCNVNVIFPLIFHDTFTRRVRVCFLLFFFESVFGFFSLSRVTKTAPIQSKQIETRRGKLFLKKGKSPMLKEFVFNLRPEIDALNLTL